jgi:hypothetical protein
MTPSKVEFYFNGEKNDNPLINTFLPVENINSIAIGKIINSGNNNYANSGSFRMSDFRIWNRVLTDTEISNNIRVELSGFEDNLIRWYPLDNIIEDFTQLHNFTVINDLVTEPVFTNDPDFNIFGDGDPFKLTLNNIVDLTLAHQPETVVDVDEQTVGNARRRSITTTTSVVSSRP